MRQGMPLSAATCLYVCLHPQFQAFGPCAQGRITGRPLQLTLMHFVIIIIIIFVITVMIIRAVQIEMTTSRHFVF